MPDFDPFNRRPARPMVTRRQRFHTRMPDLEEVPGFEVSETTYSDPVNGILVDVTRESFVAVCGHVVGYAGPQEIAAQCFCCAGWICQVCVLRCQRCLSILCPSCSERLHETKVYCRRCKYIELAKEAALSGCWALHRALAKELE